MNIFVVDDDQTVCAQILDDLRLRKMLLETAQLLCTAARFYGSVNPILYKSTHEQHPCSIWTRKSYSNYNWLLIYFIKLHDEYIFRFNKTHLSFTKLYRELVIEGVNIPGGERTEFANCSLYKDLDVFNAYKITLVEKWSKDKRHPKWTKRNRPTFYVDY